MFITKKNVIEIRKRSEKVYTFKKKQILITKDNDIGAFVFNGHIYCIIFHSMNNHHLFQLYHYKINYINVNIKFM